MTKPVFGTFEWAKYSINCVSGCIHECHYCLSGDTNILMNDYSVKMIKDIKIGEKLIGISKSGMFYHFTETEVLNHWSSTSKAVKILLKNGTELICSPNHKWLTNRGWKYTLNNPKEKGFLDRPYITTKNSMSGLDGINIYNLPVTDQYKRGYLSGIIKGDGNLGIYDYSGERNNRNIDIQYHFRLVMKDFEGVNRTKNYLNYFGIDTNDFLFPMKDRKTKKIILCQAIRTNKKDNYYKINEIINTEIIDEEFSRGFLAGIIDAEGGNTSVLRIYNTNLKIIDMITNSLDKLNVKNYIVEKDKDISVVRIVGGFLKELELLAHIDIAIKRKIRFIGQRITNHTDSLKIVSIENLNKEIEMYDITTGTSNFIANGVISHNCYARAKFVKNGGNPNDWNKEIINKKAINKEYKKYDGVVMFPTTHDITETNIDACLIVLHKLLKVDNNVLIVSKPHLKCVKRLCEELNEYKNNILFRFTIGSANNYVLKLWEPSAPDFQERIESLILAFKNGFQTSLSCEPMLDGNINEVITIAKPFITDAIWLGKMNFAIERLTQNRETEYIGYAKRLMEIQSNENILILYEQFKDDPKIKWKDSIKEIVGLERITEPGLDK